jgi:nucleoredoxin
MRISLITVFLVLFCVGSVSNTRAEDFSSMRTWTSASGAELEARLVGRNGDLVILEKADGSRSRIRLNQLSREDQLMLGASTSPAANKENKNKEIPKELEELFGKSLITAKKSRVSTADLSGKKIGVYFSAHWCPPCRKFTPVLVNTYNELQEEGKPFEIVFVSSDRTEQDMIGYMKEMDMPWLAVRFKSSEADDLKEKFNVRGIPFLAIINDKGETLSVNARSEVTSSGTSAYDRW